MALKTFNRVALIGRHHVEGVGETLQELKAYLESQGVAVICEQETATLMNNTCVSVIEKDQLADFADLIIVVGGDGSLLNAAKIASTQDLPVLGINRGSLGFLTDISPDDFGMVGEVIAGHYLTEERFLLEAQLPDGSHIALNDVVLHPGKHAHMIHFNVTIDQNFAYHLRADGLIVATPTGSTAYALSVGGPILHPQLDAIVVVPISPHTLSSRPIVVPEHAHIEVEVTEENRENVLLSCDGQQRITVEPGTTFSVKKHRKKFSLIHPESYQFYDTLRTKLDWKG